MVLNRVSIVQKGMTKMMYLHRGSADTDCPYIGKYFLVPVEKMDGEETLRPKAGF